MARQKKEKQELDLELYTRSGKLRKRRRKKSKEYFDQTTEDAVIEYITTEDHVKKSILFNDKIDYAIHKLAQNIIHTFKFHYTDLVNYTELEHEVVAFLLQKIHLYDSKKGKAYSYLGTIAKRYLIQYNDKNYKNKKRRGEIEEISEDKNIELVETQDNSDRELSLFIDAYVNHVEKKIDWYFIDESERDIVNVILDFFKKREGIDIFNKQIFYLYTREISGQNSTKITKVISKLKFIFKRTMKEYYIHGCLKTDESDIYTKRNL